MTNEELKQAAREQARKYHPTREIHGDMEAFVAAMFYDGAMYALDNLWTRVEDELPITGNDGCSEYVLVLRGPSFIPKVAMYTTNEFTKRYTFKVGRKSYENHWFTPDFEPLNHIVTHWMRVPLSKGKEIG